jgi:hypothetical protein
MFLGLCIMGGLNLMLCFGCLAVVTNTSYTGPEGIGSALLLVASLLLSFILTGIGLRQLYTEWFQKSLNARTVIATLVAVSPFIAWFFFKASRWAEFHWRGGP